MLAPLSMYALINNIIRSTHRAIECIFNSMATKWFYEFFTDTTNAMSIEERIKETVANIGNGGVVFPDGECCSTEEELRSLLVKKKILEKLENAPKAGWIGKTATIITSFVIVTFFISCGSNTNSSSSNNVSTDDITTEYSQELVKLAHEGVAVAQNNLGLCYSKGNGVAQNKQEAIKWYTKAAEQG